MIAHRPQPLSEDERPERGFDLGTLTASALQTLAQAAAMSGFVFPSVDAFREGHGR